MFRVVNSQKQDTLVADEILGSDPNSANASTQGPQNGRSENNSAEEFALGADVGDDPITRNLRLAFAAVAAEPMPEHLLQLLAQLDEPNGASDE